MNKSSVMIKIQTKDNINKNYIIDKLIPIKYFNNIITIKLYNKTNWKIIIYRQNTLI